MPEERERGAGLRDLLSFAGPHRGTIILATALGLVGALAALAQPLLVGEVLKSVRTGGSVFQPAALLVALFVLDAAFSGFQGYLMGRTGEGVVFGVRRALVGRLLRMTVAEHDRRRTGDLLSRVGTDTTLLKAALAQSLTNIVVGVVVFVGAILLMALIDPLLLAVALACVAVATAVVLVVATRVREATEEAQERVGTLGAALERAIRAIRTVKIGRAEDREEEAISGEAGAAYEAGVRAAAYEALIGPATNVALQGSFVLVLGVGGARLASGDLALEDLVAFLLYLLYLVGPLVIVFSSFAELQQGLAAMGRIREVLESPVERSSGATPGPEHPAAPVARLDRVGFGYGPDRPVLNGVSFEVTGPGLTALVGPSGAGKSTVFSLLVRFYEADSGTVELNGTDVRQLPLNELRGRVAYVEQDAPVLAGTVRQNLLYANPDATGEDLNEVIGLANLHRFIEKLPNGLDTEVGDGGTLLSGGERQRIALARMLLCKPGLLLLDEVTSQLDAGNERALKETISKVTKRCAVVVIAHRLSTVVEAGKILLLDGGRLTAEGTHDELLENSPLYGTLVRTQMIEAEGLSNGDRSLKA
ncbi:ATP-binding cassette domain-containing protein [Rubrobacter tropicus]|uniref:ATP-binding cassette domain-containing protein n=1 Tax=Rubrobacter tropicus TaxID=2653851 RepID=A0A6G8Q4H9_9ACTN|nr:ABC transporter ATP-binding protein [Rubrobacter tropicus]QIN81227.1 ATP-binding cassette domain-containing protein [Rubrobacter tropicus]